MKDKTEVEQRVKKYLKEKDKVEGIVQKTQTIVQKLYKVIPEVPIVVEATMEEQVLIIDEVIKGFRVQIEDLKLWSILGTPPEVQEGRERMPMTVVTNIKKVEENCTKLCEEREKIWIDLAEELEMKVMEARLREEKERAQQASDKITTLSPAECMTTILAQRQSYLEVDKLRDQQNILQQ